ncbi:codeine O-demethylase-like [Humulus lupulus]|uniref:codeine O-demethylase-like n=1 Tax=Humulus lupulus TaxID=3486 RepID=UPI002B4136DB|nr:codeine O-demethylase-like [Humulus lupulus]
MASSTSADNHQSDLTSLLEITKKPLVSIPEQYIRTDHLPAEPVVTTFSTTNQTIPTIDMASLSLQSETSSDHHHHQLIQNLHSACKHWGFFQLVNHGVSRSVIEEVSHEIEGFFKLPLEEKLQYKVTPDDFEGYGSVVRSDDHKLDWGDRVFMITNPISRRKPHLLPELPSSLKNSLERYIDELKKLGMTLFGLLAKALNVEKKMLVEELFEDGMQSMRMTCYPACPEPEKVIGFSPHSDAAGITILHQLTSGVNGLQVKKDGAWIPVNFLPNAFVVNIGDVIEIVSNGVYKSIEHRVMANSSKERISVAMFFNAKYESEIGPLPCLVNSENNDDDDDNPPLFRRVGMEDYINHFFSRRKYDGKSFLDLMRIKHTNNTNA